MSAPESREEVHPKRAHHRRIDWILVTLVALLGLSLGSFAMGWIPYPFGILVLCLFIAARAAERRTWRGAQR